jgi:hypothetical protein
MPLVRSLMAWSTPPYHGSLEAIFLSTFVMIRQSADEKREVIDDVHVWIPALESPLDCTRCASTVLPPRCHRVPPKCTVAAETGSESAFRWNTAACVYTIETAHNPESRGFKSRPRC